MKRFLFVILLMSSFWLAGCVDTAQAVPDFSQRPIQAVATTGMVADVVKNVGGEHIQLTQLMGSGVDPHLYKPSERNVIAIADADVIFYSGLHLEAQMGKVFEKMQGRLRTAAVTDTIDRTKLSSPPQFEGNYDPHVWFDVSMWMKTVDVVRDTLIEMDPAHAQDYRQNAADYLAELQDLDQYIRDQAALLPPEKRVLITAHDAFSYFGRAYGFDVRGLQGISTATEAGAGDVQGLADFIAQRQIPAIFVESSVPRRTIEAVQAAVRSRGYEVKIGGELFSDAMGTPGTPEGTYIGMVKHNIDTIVGALAGNQ